MARRPLLLPSLVLLLLAAGMLVVEAEESQEQMKLCGNEVLKTIVSTCGSSRSQRSPKGWADVKEQDEQDSDWESIEGATKDITKGWPSVFQIPRKGRRQAPEEDFFKYCCETGCTKEELRKYC